MKLDGLYNQYEKNYVRHVSLKYAIELLTLKREYACCVERNYVRKIYDYFVMNEDENTDKTEAKKISSDYMLSWEILHDSCTGTKHPRDLTICYLCGPEPDNDFKEMISLGILPQNIWAFEYDSNAYKKALAFYKEGDFPQPHILKQNIETFFEQTPKKFDIIYIDACGSVPSSKHALKCITTACLCNRLNSPGIIISNFAEPNDNKSDYIKLMKQYMFTKNCKDDSYTFDDWLQKSDECNEFHHNFYENYSEFISAILRDVPSIIVPVQRLYHNPYVEQLVYKNKALSQNMDENFFSSIKNHSIAKYFCGCNILRQRNQLDKKTKIFLSEIGQFDSVLSGLKLSISLKNESQLLKNDIRNIKQFFEEESIYQFLDKHHSNLLFDVIINQLTYPLHYNTSMGKRYQYKAKSTEMFTDITVYDECRYIYDWLPALHQITSAYKNISWQYIFRCALDGLVKLRQEYNDEFFFQGSVVSNDITGFEKKSIPPREKI